jgi:hypothetical protein
MQPDSDGEPFLLHESSQAFLDGDQGGIGQRFAFRRDALDYLAMAAIAVGILVLVIDVARFAGWLPAESTETTVTAFILAVLLIVGGGYFVNSRQSAAAARGRLIREGQVLSGTLNECTARDETTTEGSFGEVTRSYLVAVEYRFTSPAGDEIADRDEHDRPEMRRRELPVAGAAVRVLYLDEQNYALL